MTSAPIIATIVEGHGEVKALPVLLRRIASELLSVHHIVVPPTIPGEAAPDGDQQSSVARGRLPVGARRRKWRDPGRCGL